MTKAVSFSLVFLFLFTLCASAPAQMVNTATAVPTSQPPSGSTAEDIAVNQAILDQANTIVLRQKLVQARAAADHGDLPAAAKLYEDAYGLTQQIGSGIQNETAQTISGLVSVRMELAQQAQKNGDYLEADAQVSRVLKVDPHNSGAIAFKQKNQAILDSMKGKMPDTDTLNQVPLVTADKQQADTLVQDGKLLYEMGKFEEAEVKLDQALKLDPDNQAAYYYLNLVKQAYYGREEEKRVTGAQDAMVQVQKQWTPKAGIGLPAPNPYVTNRDVHTGAGREVIYSKLDRIRLDNVSWPDGLPLSEALRYLNDQSQKRDPDKKGINFVFNPNPSTDSSTATGNGTGPVQINPNTGQPETTTPANTEPVDPSTINVKLALTDVSLHDALDAIVLVADHRIQYSVEDWGVVFSTKPAGSDQPELEMRVFHVDPNTFYQGLQSVGSFTFGSANTSSSGSGSSGSSGGSSSSSGSSGGSSGNNVNGAVVPVVDIAPGGVAGGGGGGGGGGGRGGGGGGGGGGNTGAVVGGGSGLTANAGAQPGGTVGNSTVFSGDGVSYLTVPGYMQNVSLAAEAFFDAVGVNLSAPGRSVAFNDRLGLLFVKATPSELDTIERVIQALNQVAPQVHIKARFIEISQDDSAALGFDWYLGQFGMGNGVVGQGGNAGSLGVTPSPSSPDSVFPGTLIGGTTIPQSVESLTSGLRNSGPALATVTGILTDPNFQVVIHALSQRSGVETLAEPEVVTTSGRQTQMRATDIQYILTGFGFQAGNTGTTTPGTTGTP